MHLALSRRSLLRLGAAAAATATLDGCARQSVPPAVARLVAGVTRHPAPSRPAPTASRTGSAAAASASNSNSNSSAGVIPLAAWGGPARLPHVIAAFAEAHPEIALSSLKDLGQPPAYYLSGVDAQVLRTWGHAFAALDSALRTVNFDPRTLLAGSVAPYVRQGATLALPYAEVPWAVRWRTDAFAAAALPPPTANWTVDDFKAACVALQATARKGVIEGLEGALLPLAFPPSPPGANAVPIGTLDYPGLWQAFVWGFGGTIVADGQFQLTDQATVAGIEALLELQQFAVSGTSGYALAFDLYSSDRLAPPWQWARLPRFPLDPVVTTVSYAQGLAWTQTGQPPPNVLAAAVAFMLWLYQPTALGLLASGGDPPALASDAAQAQYWQNKPDGATAVGDWTHFRDCYDGFPSVVAHGLYSAVSSILFDGAPVPGALAAAEAALNSGRTLPLATVVSVNPTAGNGR